MNAVAKLDAPNLQALADILGATDTGLTGAEIGRYRRECGIDDPVPDMTKRHRLFAALKQRQNADGYANGVLAFVRHVMNPVRHVGNKQYFDREREDKRRARLQRTAARRGRQAVAGEGRPHSWRGRSRGHGVAQGAGRTAGARRRPQVLSRGACRRQLLPYGVRGHQECGGEAARSLRWQQSQRDLELLTAAALVRRTVQGRDVYFQANREAPIFPELRGLFAKTTGLVDVVRDGLAPLGDRVQLAFVFGSAARSEFRSTSDIDLLLVGDAPFEDVVRALAAAQNGSAGT